MAGRSPGLASIVIASVVASMGCAAGDALDAPALAEEGLASRGAEKWFVELSGEPLSRGGDAALLAMEKAEVRADIAAAAIPVVERYAFDRLWNGLSIHVNHRDASALAGLAGVKAIHPVVPIALDGGGSKSVWNKPHGARSSAPELFTSIGMMGADVAQSTLGLTGAGVRVGVIDSGIDIHHPDLGGSGAGGGGCFGPGCRVAFGADLVGDDYDSGTSGSLPVPDAIPDDCLGHGTHVAGIVGANGAMKGVAPNVVFGAYRVFGCNGTTDADIMLKAMELAEADGMRVVNMSIGAPFEWPDYPTAKGADQLVRDGVVVVCSIGNSGTSGIWAAGAPGVGELSIGAASFDNTATAHPALTLSPDAAKVAYSAAGAPAPAPPSSGAFPIARTGSPTTDGDGCVNPPAAGSLAGKIALIRRGSAPSPAPTCSFYAKAKAAMAAGAAGVLIYNNTTGLLSPSVVGNPPITIPTVLISQADGLSINARLDAGPVTMTWSSLVASLPSPTGGQVSSFSSYGLPPDLSFKPDLGAPGGNIYSTYPLELGGYASLSGTSMASPHVAGAAALLVEARPDVPAMSVRDLLQNTAIPSLSLGVPDPAHRQGAGMIHVDAAIRSEVVVTPAKLALGESQAGPRTVTLTANSQSTSDVVYDLSHVAAASTQGSFLAPTVSAAGAASVSWSAASLLVPAGGAASVDVTIAADPALADRAIYGGYLVLTPQGGGQTLRVPYAGYKGDYQAITALSPTGQGYPWLAKKSGGLKKQPNGATFTLQAGDVPYVVVHLDHGVRRLKIDVFDAVKGKPYGSALDLEHVAQHDAPTKTSAYAWDGTTVFNKDSYAVPNGTYVLRLSVLKALGDPENAADWETWTSPVVTLDHP